MRLLISPNERLIAIEARRKAVLKEGITAASNDWLERSWIRCVAANQDPEDQAVFQAVSHSQRIRIIEENRPLIVAAQPVLANLAKSIARTQYFAVLTDKNGIVLNASGAFDRSDRRASQITTVGVDLSENAVGTTAIGAALIEQKPVWLHKSEHFLTSNRIYSCAGAPIFGLQNECIGMLDLTGIEVPERRELVKLAVHSARDIQNALLTQRVNETLGLKILQVQWLGTPFDGVNTAMIAFDEEGKTAAFNQAALDWLPDLAIQTNQPCESLFSMSTTEFFSSLHEGKTATLPLWSGIQVNAKWAATETPGPEKHSAPTEPNLKRVEAELVHRAITAAKGNVAIAAQKLGISRATLYRKLQKVMKR